MYRRTNLRNQPISPNLCGGGQNQPVQSSLAELSVTVKRKQLPGYKEVGVVNDNEKVYENMVEVMVNLNMVNNMASASTRLENNIYFRSFVRVFVLNTPTH